MRQTHLCFSAGFTFFFFLFAEADCFEFSAHVGRCSGCAGQVSSSVFLHVEETQCVRWSCCESVLSNGLITVCSRGLITAQQMVAQSRPGSLWYAANPPERAAAIKEPSASHILNSHTHIEREYFHIAF